MQWNFDEFTISLTNIFRQLFCETKTVVAIHIRWAINWRREFFVEKDSWTKNSNLLNGTHMKAVSKYITLGCMEHIHKWNELW